MSNNIEQQLFEKIQSFKYDPLGFVNYAFPWGKKGTDLAKFKSLKKWQIAELERITKQLIINRDLVAKGENAKVIYLAICSGRGNGKSALISILNLWALSCWIGVTAIVTANTEPQLRGKTFAELSKWHGMMINRHWFEKSGINISPASWYSELLSKQLNVDSQYNYIKGVTWNKDNPDSFAGAHSQRGMMVTYDEASGVDDSIWDVSEGFFSDFSPFRMWVVMSNGRKNTGAFYECFNKNKEAWWNTNIDVREVEDIDLTFAERILAEADGNEDSFKYRVEVRGLFPLSGENQFIDSAKVKACMERENPVMNEQALVLGVDVARYGDDETALVFRRGRDARSIPKQMYKGLNNYAVADKVMEAIAEYKVDGVFIDGGGTGSGVVDILKRHRYRVIEVQFKERPDDVEKYSMRRDEIWGRMREWVNTGCLPDDDVIYRDLCGIGYEIKENSQLKLESKKDIKKRGGVSPDYGDALAMTFTRKIAPPRFQNNKIPMFAKSDYDVFRQ